VLRERGVGRCRRDEPAQRTQLPDGVPRSVGQQMHLRHARQDALVWEKFSAELLPHNGHPKAIQYAAIAMNAAYTKEVIDSFGNIHSWCTIRKFRVIQYVLECGEQIRQIASQTDAEKRNQLERTRWIWPKNQLN
jgi:hypothetical protein